MPVDVLENKFCEQCQQVKAVDEFRRRSRKGIARVNQCRSCHNKAERARLDKRREQVVDATLDAFHAKMKREDEPTQIVLLCNAMIAQFGGTVGFMNAWWCQIERATADSPGSKRVLDCFMALLRLTEYCDAFRPQHDDLTDEQLDEMLDRDVERKIQARPELVMACAEKLGWTVIPPDNADAEYSEDLDWEA